MVYTMEDYPPIMGFIMACSHVIILHLLTTKHAQNVKTLEYTISFYVLFDHA